MSAETDPGVEPKNAAQWKEAFSKVLNCDKNVVSIKIWRGMLTVGTIGSPQYVTSWKGRDSLVELVNLISSRALQRQTERLHELRQNFENTQKGQTDHFSRLQADATEAQRLMSLIPDEEITP